jgi:hypothetical protein
MQVLAAALLSLAAPRAEAQDTLRAVLTLAVRRYRKSTA